MLALDFAHFVILGGVFSVLGLFAVVIGLLLAWDGMTKSDNPLMFFGGFVIVLVACTLVGSWWTEQNYTYDSTKCNARAYHEWLAKDQIVTTEEGHRLIISTHQCTSLAPGEGVQP